MAGLAMLLMMALLRLFLGWPTPTELIFDRLFPLLTVEFFISSLVRAGGYTPLNKEPFLKHTFDSRAYRAIYPARQLAEWQERNQCPANDKLCEEAVWFTQTMMLGLRKDMDQIAEAVSKIQRQAGALIERS